MQIRVSMEISIFVELWGGESFLRAENKLQSNFSEVENAETCEIDVSRSPKWLQLNELSFVGSIRDSETCFQQWALQLGHYSSVHLTVHRNLFSFECSIRFDLSAFSSSSIALPSAIRKLRFFDKGFYWLQAPSHYKFSLSNKTNNSQLLFNALLWRSFKLTENSHH